MASTLNDVAFFGPCVGRRLTSTPNRNRHGMNFHKQLRKTRQAKKSGRGIGGWREVQGGWRLEEANEVRVGVDGQCCELNDPAWEDVVSYDPEATMMCGAIGLGIGFPGDGGEVNDKV